MGDHVEFESRGNGEIVLRNGAASSGWESRAGRGREGRAGRSGKEPGVAPNNVQKALKGINYPARKADLVAHARKTYAPGAVKKIVERFPDREYGGPQEFMKAFGEIDSRP